MILQGKGGVGKSFVASLLAQYLLDKDQGIACFDTDPVNATFHAYEAIQVEKVEVMEGGNINTRYFDKMMGLLLELPPHAHAVIDNGASTFIPLSAYMEENSIEPLLTDSGHTLIIHSIVTGGQSEDDTLHGLSRLLDSFNSRIVIWVNPYFGAIDFSGHDLEKSNLQRKGQTLYIPDYKKETFGFDIESMLSMRFTFAEAIESPKFNIMARQRLKIVRDDIWGMLGSAEIDQT